MRRICWPWWTVLFWIAVWVVGILAVTIAQASCARTPAEAAESAADGATRPAAGDGGFRVESMRWDPVLQQRWAQIANCAHPEWPAVEMLVHGPKMAAPAVQRIAPLHVEASLSASPIVRAGDAVQLWIQQGNLRIEAAAIAEQSAGMGQTVRVRLMQRKTLGQQKEEEFRAVVRGPHDVEIEQ